MTEWLGWYFSDATETLRFGDGRKIEVGATHTVECVPVVCEEGLHACKHVLDALNYAPGAILWRVRLSGTIAHGADKSCATERTYLARLDATEMLRAFARKCAMGVIHLWDAPAVVRQYLETGDENLREAAREAAREVADTADARAARAAWSAEDAAKVAAEAARSASWAAEAAWANGAASWAGEAAWAAEEAANRAATEAGEAAWAAYAAARNAARDAARAAQRKNLDEMALKAIEEAA